MAGYDIPLIRDKSITAEQLQDSSVSTEALQPNCVTTDKLSNGLNIGDSICDTQSRNSTTVQVVNANHVFLQRHTRVKITNYQSSGQPANTISVTIDKVAGFNYASSDNTYGIQAGDVLEYYAYDDGIMWHAPIMAILSSSTVRVPANGYFYRGMASIGFIGGNVGNGYTGFIASVK